MDNDGKFWLTFWGLVFGTVLCLVNILVHRPPGPPATPIVMALRVCQNTNGEEARAECFRSIPRLYGVEKR